MKKKIKLFDPAIDKEEISSVTKVLKSKFWASGAGIAKKQERLPLPNNNEIFFKQHF